MSRKLFCVLEQGSEIGSAMVQEHRRQFETAYSDLYRLNWVTDRDPDAQFHADNITWSEGRSLLYERVPKDYDYYIFIDDDVKFSTSSNGGDVALTIKNFLTDYQPVSGCLWSDNWHSELVKRVHPRLALNFFPYMGQDLECMIFSSAFAELVFPVIYHGCWGSMWYANYFCYRLYPEKQICCSQVTISNTRHNPNVKEHQHFDRETVASLLNSHLKQPEFPPGDQYQSIVKVRNLELYGAEISRAPVTATLEDLGTIYDVHNEQFVNRSPRLS